MKKTIVSLLDIITNSKLFWPLMRPIVKFGRILSGMRTLKAEKYRLALIGKTMFQDLTVQNGPFKGMIYPSFDSFGSSIVSKLIGSYEKELWGIAEWVKSQKYSEIIDIGCAEGYYAVGFALKTEGTKMYAFDTSPVARKLCASMAQINEVSDKVNIKSECTPELLANFTFASKGLIICDCEGYEKTLFNKVNLDNMSKCDLIIETHDILDISISTYLKELFRNTHDVESIMSVDDVQKALTYDFEITRNMSLSERKELFAENRGGAMEWLICKAKATKNH